MIEPMRVEDWPVERALSMYPSLDLDMYIYANVITGPMDMIRNGSVTGIPQFSRVFGDCKILLVMAQMELGCMMVDMSPDYFPDALREGFIIRKTPTPTWRISVGSGLMSYGRSFEEALCKLLILHKFGKK